MRVLRNAGLAFGATIVGVVLFCAVFAELLMPHDPFAQDLTRRLLPPFWVGGMIPRICSAPTSWGATISRGSSSARGSRC
jgi:ABC-type dipeptide/oligopeptide/nickel transport system permease subunit